MGGGVLKQILANLGDNAASQTARYGAKLAPYEMRDLAVNSLADNILAGDKDTAMSILTNSPILTRSEAVNRTAARNAPDYQNVAVTTLNNAPVGFGGGSSRSHLTVLDPELMNRPGQKAIAMEDTAWTPYRGMDPLTAQNRLFIGEHGASKIDGSRDALREIAWDEDNLERMGETGWLELNAPITNRDVLATGKRQSQGYVGMDFQNTVPKTVGSQYDAMQNVYSDISAGSSRDEIMSKINKYLPVFAGGIPATGVLGGLLGNNEPERVA